MVNILKDNPLKFVEVIPCRLHGPRGIVKAFLLTEGPKMLLVDTGYDDWDSDLITDRIGNIGRNPKDVDMVFLTHRDGDHTGGLKKLRRELDFKVACHELEGGWVEKNTGIKPDILLKDGDMLPYAGGTRVVHMPGHSDGHAGLYISSHRTFIAGDSVLSAGEHLMPSPGSLGDKPELAKESAKKLLNMDVDVILVAHGDDIYHDASDAIKRMFVERRTQGR